MSETQPGVLSATKPGRVRQKRFSEKVRTGCTTCRRRRVKCDETKASCKKCINAGLVCEGYKAIFVNISAPTNALAKRNIQHQPRRLSQDFGTPMPSLMSEDTLRSFQYYLEVFCPIIVGPFPKRKAFWTKVLPQAARTHQAVLHCLTSAALSNEDRSSATASDLYIKPRKQFHYNAALRILTREQLSLDVALFCGIALFVFSTYEREEAHARLHLNSGLRMIREYEAQKQAGTCTLLAEQRELVEETCVSFFNAATGILAYIFPLSTSHKASTIQVQPFDHEEQAMSQLVNLAHLVARQSVDSQQLLTDLSTWKGRFEAMKVRMPPDRQRFVMLFFKCIDRTVDLFAADADLVVRPTRLRAMLGLIENLAGSPFADNSICQGLSAMLAKMEDVCEVEQDRASVETIRMYLLERLNKPVVPYS